ncbi:MAG: hypothetical protein MUE73_05250 [Planctomycetes bacterium]|jgi:hypothetical protein|nr:hypothetical protein [Planctomycetota bacterium]
MRAGEQDRDVGERIGRKVSRARRLARCLRTFEIAYVLVFGVPWAIFVAPYLADSFRVGDKHAGWLFGLGGVLNGLSGIALLVFALVLAEIARRMVLVVADLAEDAREIV